jgi:hypothetical protein
MARKVADCRRFPSVSGCTMTLSGEEDELLAEAREHAIRVHGHEGGAELDQALREGLEDEPAYLRRISSPATFERGTTEELSAF